MLERILKKQHRMVVESRIISNYNIIKQRFSFQLTSLFSQKSCKVPHLKLLVFINYLYLFTFSNVFGHTSNHTSS